MPHVRREQVESILGTFLTPTHEKTKYSMIPNNAHLVNPNEITIDVITSYIS
jgi:hypothetical protein